MCSIFLSLPLLLATLFILFFLFSHFFRRVWIWQIFSFIHTFDPETKYFSFRHFWILLPDLPLYLWNEGALKAIGEALGSFIMLDRATLISTTRKVGRILVEMDISHGLPESLEID
jgi:hypothetical protein